MTDNPFYFWAVVVGDFLACIAIVKLGHWALSSKDKDR